MAAQFCSTCGAPAVAGDRFCRKCGETLFEATMDLPREAAQGRMEEIATQVGVAAYPPSGAGQFGYSPAPQAPYGYGYGMAVADSKPLAQFDVEYPQRSSRGLIFISWWLLVIPHLIVLNALAFVAMVIWFISWWAILFTGRYPRGMFDFMVGYLRWSLNVTAYVMFMRDEYPPFSLEPGRYPVHFSIDYPSNLSHGLIFIKWLLVIPHQIVLYVLGLAAAVCWFIAWWAILFTGRYPPGMFNFLVGVLRWSMRVSTYLLFMTDRYPPFSTDANPS